MGNPFPSTVDTDRIMVRFVQEPRIMSEACDF